MGDIVHTQHTNELDILGKIESLAKTIRLLEEEKEKTEKEFGIQRAKMKELFVQKEEELKKRISDQESLKEENKRVTAALDDLRSQLTVASLEYQSKLEDEKRKFNEELCSLQQLLAESMEETMKYEKEVERLEVFNQRLLAEMNRSKEVNSSGGDMPQLLQVPGTVISSIARTVKSQITTQLGGSSFDSGSLGSNSVTNSNEDSLEDSMRKAQEDAEVLRSVVIPLEEEIKALKDKIREMDGELQKYQKQNHATDDTTSAEGDTSVTEFPELTFSTTNLEQSSAENPQPSSHVAADSNLSPRKISRTADTTQRKSPISCPSCSNHESQLLNAQEKINDLEKHIIRLERYKQELNKETIFREKMEATWNEEREEYKEQVATLQNKVKKAEEVIKELQATFTNAYAEFTQELKRLRDDRKRCQLELNRLHIENDDLMGRYTKHSSQLQNEPIDLPNTVQELQEVALHYQEELIRAKIANEKMESAVAEFKTETGSLRNQIAAYNETFVKLNKICCEINDHVGNENLGIKLMEEVSLDQIVRDFANLRSYIYTVVYSKRKMEETISQLRMRVLSLQTELDNSEKVQKDFVLLSQSLQLELERIREDDIQVRWEHEDDVSECRGCKSSFSVAKRKHNCRHCGRIFCSSCLAYTVNSGPNNRPSKVCNVCHTLLVRDTAPYFSTSVSSSLTN